ncbi:cytochrome c4 [Oleiagrimonas sp. C23AA]|nr:cytochrome c4 [Oleiagrimonas sp. C23AA]
MAQDTPGTSKGTPATTASSAAAASPTASALGTAQNAAGPIKDAPKAPAHAAGELSGNIAKGQAKAAVCGACHGPDGNSTDAQYPKLAGQSEHYIVNQLENFKHGVRQNPIMLGFAAQLSEQDMHDVGAYFASQTSRPGVADEKLVKAGETLYRQGDASKDVPACMACHGPDGRGNPGAPYPQLAGQHADYIQATLKAWHDGTSWGSDAHAKIMPAIAQRLSAEEIAAVSSYVEGLHGPAPNETTGSAAP